MGMHLRDILFIYDNMQSAEQIYLMCLVYITCIKNNH